MTNEKALTRCQALQLTCSRLSTLVDTQVSTRETPFCRQHHHYLKGFMIYTKQEGQPSETGHWPGCCPDSQVCVDCRFL